MSRPSINHPAPGGFSTPDSVLRMDEILDNILGFNEVGDAARCARVCKGWTNASLNRVWHTISDLVPLLSLLAPVIKSGGILVRLTII